MSAANATMSNGQRRIWGSLLMAASDELPEQFRGDLGEFLLNLFSKLKKVDWVGPEVLVKGNELQPHEQQFIRVLAAKFGLDVIQEPTSGPLAGP